MVVLPSGLHHTVILQPLCLRLTEDPSGFANRGVFVVVITVQSIERPFEKKLADRQLPYGNRSCQLGESTPKSAADLHVYPSLYQGNNAAPDALQWVSPSPRKGGGGMMKSAVKSPGHR